MGVWFDSHWNVFSCHEDLDKAVCFNIFVQFIYLHQLNSQISRVFHVFIKWYLGLSYATTTPSQNWMNLYFLIFFKRNSPPIVWICSIRQWLQNLTVGNLSTATRRQGRRLAKNYGFDVFFGGVLVAVVVEVCLSSFGFFVHSPTTAATGQIEAIVE